MPVYRVQGPDGRIYRVEGPEGATEEQVLAALQEQLAPPTPQKAFTMPRMSMPEAEVQEPERGMLSSLVGGAKRMASTGQTALESIIDPEGAARRGVERGQEIGQQYAPGADWDRVAQAYREKGLLSAAGETLSQIPSAVMEQLPQIGVTLGSAKAGALAGTAFGPVGTLIGGGLGAITPSLLQLYGANVERQAEAQQEAGEELDISRARALGAAVPGAALEAAATLIPFGRAAVGKLLGPEAARYLAAPAGREIVEESLKRVLTKGAVIGTAAEVPTEVTQQMLERLQAGLPLTSDEALAEYGRAAYGATLVGAPVGSAGRVYQRSVARGEKEAEEAEAARVAQEEAARTQAQYRQSPEYVLDVEQRFNAFNEEVKALRAKANVKVAKDDLAGKAEQREAGQQLSTLVKENKDLINEYNAVKGRLPEIREQQRVGALSPMDYLLEQTGEVQTAEAAPSTALEPSDADLGFVPPAMPGAATSRFVNERIALAQSQLPEPEISDYQAYLMTDRAMAERAVAERPAIEGLSSKEQRQLYDSVDSLIKLQKQAEEKARADKLAEDMAERSELLRAQREQIPETPDLFAEQQLEAANDTFRQRWAYAQNLGVVPSLIEGATARPKPLIEVSEDISQMGPARVQSVLSRIDALEARIQAPARTDEQRQARQAAMTELSQLRSDDADPYVRELLRSRSTQSQTLMDLQDAIEDIRRNRVDADRDTQDQLRDAMQQLSDLSAQIAQASDRNTLEQLTAQRGPLMQQIQTLQNRLGGPSPDTLRYRAPVEALNRRAERARDEYVQAVLEEAAINRRASGDMPLTSEEAASAAFEARQALDEIIVRGQAQRGEATGYVQEREPELGRAVENLQRDVERAERRVRRAQSALAELDAAAADATTPSSRFRSDYERTRAQQALAKRMLELEEAKRVFADATKTLVPGDVRLRKGDIRPLEERPFGNYRAAVETQLDQLQQIRQRLNAPVPRQVAEGLRVQFPETEAQRTAEARGETATTLGGELRRRTEFVRDKMSRMKGMRPQAASVLNRAADLMDAGRATRDLLDAVEPVVDTINRGQMPFARDLRAIDEAIKATEPTAREQQEAGQQALDLSVEGSAEVAPRPQITRDEIGQARVTVPESDGRYELDIKDDLGLIKRTAAEFNKEPLVVQARKAIDRVNRALENQSKKVEARQRQERAVAELEETLRTRLQELNTQIRNAFGLYQPEADMPQSRRLTLFFMKRLTPEKLAQLPPEEQQAYRDGIAIETRYRDLQERLEKERRDARLKIADATAGLREQRAFVERQLALLADRKKTIDALLKKRKAKPTPLGLGVQIDQQRGLAEGQRKALEAAVTAATTRYERAVQAARQKELNEAGKALDAAKKALADSTGDFTVGADWKRMENLRKDLNDAQAKYDATELALTAEIETAHLQAAAAQDAKVQFEKAELERLTRELGVLANKRSGSTPVLDPRRGWVQRVNPEALEGLRTAQAEQHSRVAKAEKDLAQIKEAYDANEQRLKNRLITGEGFRRMTAEEVGDKVAHIRRKEAAERELAALTEAHEQALQKIDDAVAGYQQKIDAAEKELAKTKGEKPRNTVRARAKRAKEGIDKKLAERDVQIERFNERSRMLQARIQSSEAVGDGFRRAREEADALAANMAKWVKTGDEKTQERLLASLADIYQHRATKRVTEASPDTVRQIEQDRRRDRRATGPVVRGTPVGETRVGPQEATIETSAGTKITPKEQQQKVAKQERAAGVGQRYAGAISESKTPKEVNREISGSEMQEANRIAEELRKKTPAQRRKEAEEARKVAEEFEESRAFDPEDMTRATKDAWGDSDDALFSATRDSTVYDERPTVRLNDDAMDAARDGRILDLLDNLAQNASTPFARELAKRLRPLVMKTKLRTIDGGVFDEAGNPVEGAFRPKTNTVELSDGALFEETVLHEITHAVTVNQLDADINTLTPEQRQARQELEALLTQVRKDPAFDKQYGRLNSKELVSELLSNQDFRDRLDKMKPSLLRRIYNAMLRFFGMTPQSVSERAVENAYALFAPSKVSSGNAVASVLRGVFPGSGAKYGSAVPQSVRDTIAPPAASSKLGQKISSAALGFRTLALDRWAPMEYLIKLGVSKGKLSEVQAQQMRIHMRLHEDTNRFAAQSLTNGVVQLQEDNGKRYYGGEPSDVNMRTVVRQINEAGEALGNSEARLELWQRWMEINRVERKGLGYDVINTKKPMTAADAREIKNLVNGNAQIKQAFENARETYKQYNRDLMRQAAEAGTLPADVAKNLAEMDYIPFYRVDGDTVVLDGVGSKPFTVGSLLDQPYLKELVGDSRERLPVLDAIVQNTSMLTKMNIRNLQSQDAANLLQQMGMGKVIKGEGPANVLRFKNKGDMYWLKLEPDAFPEGMTPEMLLSGMQGVKAAVPTVLKLAGIPTQMLRATITRMPLYVVRQMIRDPLFAWMTTGGKFTPVVSSIKELTKIRRGLSPTEEKLARSGAISSNVMTGDYQDVARMLRDISIDQKGWNWAMAALDKFAMQADASTRAVLYDAYRKEGMDHVDAMLGAAESMNFARRGTSSSLFMWSTLVPFFNAQLQGIDALYRAAKGDTIYQKKMDVRNTLLKRGLLMLGATIAYSALMQEDEAYKNATPEERAMNWFVRLPGMEDAVRVPIPFEPGLIFKAIPEAIFNAAYGDDTAKDAMKAIGKQLWMSTPLQLPAAINPVIELATNYSFFTDSPIESQRERAMDSEQRYREGTTELAKMLGKTGIASPIQIEHLVRGYFSSAGILAMSMANYPLRPLVSPDGPERPELKLSQMPLFGPAFQPATGRGAINTAYDDVLRFQRAHQTFNAMVERGNVAEARAYANEFAREIALASTGGAFRQQMGELAKLRRQISASALSPSEKRERLEEIRRFEIQLAQQVRSMSRGS